MKKAGLLKTQLQEIQQIYKKYKKMSRKRHKNIKEKNITYIIQYNYHLEVYIPLKYLSEFIRKRNLL